MAQQPTVTPLHSFSVLKCAGEKTQAFLQGQLTCDMRELKAHGDHSLAAVCDHRGRMLANFWVVQWKTDYLLILPNSLSDTLKNHLHKFAVFSKVIISSEPHFFIAELTHCTEKKEEGIFITLPSDNRFLFLSDKNIFQNSAINSDETTWRKNNIQDALCILYPETSLLFTPAMIALEKLGGVSFQKGCYVGQEIIARTHYLGTNKRHLQRRTITSDTLIHPGSDLVDEAGEKIGVVVESIMITKNTYDILAVLHSRQAA